MIFSKTDNATKVTKNIMERLFSSFYGDSVLELKEGGAEYNRVWGILEPIIRKGMKAQKQQRD